MLESLTYLAENVTVSGVSGPVSPGGVGTQNGRECEIIQRSSTLSNIEEILFCLVFDLKKGVWVHRETGEKIFE